MKQKKRRALSWALAAVGTAFVALALVTALVGPSLAAQARADGRFGPGMGWSRQATPGPGDGSTQQYPGLRGRPGDGRPGDAFADHPMMIGRGMRGFGHGAWLIGLLAVAGAALVAVAVARSHRRAPPLDDAETILRREFAEGRLSEEEYRKRLDALRG